MKPVKIIALSLISLLILSGCKTMDEMGPKESTATVVGGVAGALIGSRFGHNAGRWVGAAVGTVIGGFFGNMFGQKLDSNDHAKAEQAFTEATQAPIGETVYWRNDDSGNWGSYRPVRDGEISSGEYCREFITTGDVGGVRERVYGTACKHTNGTWYVVK
jgi:surface antigen